MVVGVLSNRVDREDVTAGDHIYSWRAAYLYAHHGIYVGDGMVIHFTRATGHEIRTGTFLDRFRFSSSPATVEGPPCQKCGDLIKRQGVIMSCLDCFLDGGNLYLFEYAVSPAFFLAKARGGTCTMASSDTADVVIHRAQYLLNNGFGMYCLFKNNCEDFAIYCKTGLLVETAFSVGRSGQLASLTAAFNASPVRFLTTSAGGLAIVTSGMYCVGRYLSDIGVRRDVIKVPVERLGEHWVRHGNGTSVEMLLPKLLHADYFTEPRLEELAAKERAEPGYCCRVRDFVVGRHGYGSIKFLGETDVRGLDLESIVEFNNREVIVYKDDSKKPPVGEGLNKPAGVTLLNIKCVNKKTGEQYTEGPRVDRYKEMLVKKAEEQGAEFISFDAVKGEWKFRVKHFSSYGFW